MKPTHTRIIFSVSIAILVCAPSLVFAESYFCRATRSVGFDNRDNFQDSINYADRTEWVVRKTKPGEKDSIGKPILAPYVIYKADIKLIFAHTVCDWNGEKSLLLCDEMNNRFILNPKNGLFTAADLFGYVFKDEKMDLGEGLVFPKGTTVHLDIGKCTKID